MSYIAYYNSFLIFQGNWSLDARMQEVGRVRAAKMYLY